MICAVFHFWYGIAPKSGGDFKGALNALGIQKSIFPWGFAQQKHRILCLPLIWLLRLALVLGAPTLFTRECGTILVTQTAEILVSPADLPLPKTAMAGGLILPRSQDSFNLRLIQLATASSLTDSQASQNPVPRSVAC